MEEKIFVAEGKAYWLGSLITINFSFKDHFNYTISFLGIPLKNNGNNRKSNPKEENKQRVEDREKTTENTKGPRKEEGKKEATDSIVVVEKVKLEKNKKIKKKGKEKKSFVEKIKNIRNSILRLIEEADYRNKQWKHYYNLWKKEETQQTFLRARKKFLKVFKSILPSKWSITGELGFSDPSTTGEILGVLGILYPYTGKHILITPDFEEEKRRLQGVAKGKIKLSTLLYQILTLILNKYCFRFLKLIFSEMEENKKTKQEA